MYFSENPTGILDLSLCKIPEKTRFHPGDSGVTSLENSKVKNQNPWRFYMNFLWNKDKLKVFDNLKKAKKCMMHYPFSGKTWGLGFGLRFFTSLY